MMRRVVPVAAAVLAAVFGGCEFPRERTPSVMIVAVENLGFEAVNCDADAEVLGGLESLCDESVRFSHAFTPSPLTQAAMASVLTGLYPVDHGVRHNGPDFLSARFFTAAEAALARGYRTFFASGGAPLWRKSGLAQGFEVFDDNVEVDIGRYYRPAGESVRIATQWIAAESAAAPFFAVVHMSDTLFPGFATRTADGELRERSLAGQLAEIAESVGGLIGWLKRQRRWHSTHFVLMGVNATGAGGHPDPSDLKSKTSQVTLFIKPARREGDNMIQWRVDKNVSLVDVGFTLFRILRSDPPSASLPDLAPQDLMPALQEPEPSWQEGHLIFSESAWPEWLEGAGVRWSIRQNQFLYVHDRRPLIFNTLTDRLENFPLKPRDPLWLSVNREVVEFVRMAQIPQFRGMNSYWPDMIRSARELWDSRTPVPAVTGEEPWAKWVLDKALRDRNWPEVKRLSRAIGDPVGVFVAALHTGEKLPLPRNPCLRLFLATKGDKKALQSDCDDERALALYAWSTAKSDEERQQAQDRFVRLSRHLIVDWDIGRLNFINGLTWDVDREWPLAPTVADYLLTLEQTQGLARRLDQLLSGKDRGL